MVLSFYYPTNSNSIRIDLATYFSNIQNKLILNIQTVL